VECFANYTLPLDVGTVLPKRAPSFRIRGVEHRGDGPVLDLKPLQHVVSLYTSLKMIFAYSPPNGIIVRKFLTKWMCFCRSSGASERLSRSPSCAGHRGDKACAQAIHSGCRASDLSALARLCRRRDAASWRLSEVKRSMETPTTRVKSSCTVHPERRRLRWRCGARWATLFK